MEKIAKNKQKGVLAGQVGFALLFLFLIVYMITSQFAPLIEDTTSEQETINVSKDWIWIHEDSQASVDLPATLDVEAGETFTLTRILPDMEGESLCLSLWNKGQSLKAYVGGELRYTFDRSSFVAAGLDTPYLFVTIPLTELDSGSTITIEFCSNLPNDAGKVGEANVGSETTLIRDAITPFYFEIVIAIILLFLGLACMVGAAIMRRFTGKPEPLVYLGAGVFIGAIWILADTQTRQFIFDNVALVRDCAFLSVAFLPIPFMMYLDRIQKRRFTRLYKTIEVISGINFVVAFILYRFQVFALSQMFVVSLVMVVAAAVLGVGTFVHEIAKGKGREYRLVAVGFAAFALGDIVQLVFYTLGNKLVISGTFSALGMMVLVILCALDAVAQLGVLQVQHAKTVTKVEKLTVEALESLALTVDARDTYTSGHCKRVAEYSCEIARRLGWDEERIHDLYYMALLHDVGKIGIPDNIINKTGPLDDAEWQTMKSHTVIGAEILSGLSAIPSLERGARWHHERWDGKGYPDGLAGELVPIEARIIGTADAYDAMSSYRSYRDALPQDVIRAEVVKCRGKQFDPDFADILIQMIDEDTEYKMREQR